MEITRVFDHEHICGKCRNRFGCDDPDDADLEFALCATCAPPRMIRPPQYQSSAREEWPESFDDETGKGESEL